MYNAFIPMVNNNEIECSFQVQAERQTQTTAAYSNLNDRPHNIPLPNNYEIEYFLSGPSKESDKKASTEITKQLKKEFQDLFTGI